MRKLKNQMMEAAVLYYEKNWTQQQIAQTMGLTRQTVSKLINDAVKERIVEITIHDPEQNCADLEQALCRYFGLHTAVVAGVSGCDETLRKLMTVKRASEHLLPLLRQDGQNIALSSGRTVQLLIAELPAVSAKKSTVFPLCGATDCEQSHFSSNELARSLADKLDAGVQYAWFPYCPESREDCALFQRTTYYRNLKSRWDAIDLAIVGIGDIAVLRLFSRALGHDPGELHAAVGDVATHFFLEDGSLMERERNTLCASVENLKHARQTVAIACGDEKQKAIAGALRTGMIDTLITDEYTARGILKELT